MSPSLSGDDAQLRLHVDTPHGSASFCSIETVRFDLIRASPEVERMVDALTGLKQAVSTFYSWHHRLGKQQNYSRPIRPLPMCLPPPTTLQSQCPPAMLPLSCMCVAGFAALLFAHGSPCCPVSALYVCLRVSAGWTGLCRPTGGV